MEAYFPLLICLFIALSPFSLEWADCNIGFRTILSSWGFAQCTSSLNLLLSMFLPGAVLAYPVRKMPVGASEVPGRYFVVFCHFLWANFCCFEFSCGFHETIQTDLLGYLGNSRELRQINWRTAFLSLVSFSRTLLRDFSDHEFVRWGFQYVFDRMIFRRLL